MITDFQCTLSNAQALTATVASTNYYDSGSVYDWARGEPMALLITVDVAADFTSANETYSFSVETDDNTSFSSPVTMATKTVLAAALTVGAKVVIPFFMGAERYLQARYTLGGTTPTITVTTELKPLADIATETSNLPSGYTVTI